jgi:hypothetical protein
MVSLRKYFGVILLLSAISIFLGGCKKDDNPVEDNTATFVGTWKLTNLTATISGVPVSMTPTQAGYQMTIVSKSDNTFTMTTITSAGTTTNTGTWSISGTNLTLKYSDGTSSVFAFTLSGTTLTIKDYAYTHETFGNIKVNLDFAKQ